MAEPLGDILRSLRSAAFLSQEALAERSGLSTRTVSDIETGSARTPRLITVMLLAEALGLTPGDRARLQDAARRPAGRRTGAVALPPAPETIALVGRDDDAERVGALMERGGVRIVTLVGPAGVGKTSLAVRVANERAGLFELGAAIAELAPVTEPSQVPAAVARALGIRESADATATEAIGAYLRTRSTLLVLDNLEHLTPAAAWIGVLVAECPRITILCTSREPLHLRAEHVHAVRPLGTSAAIVLFVQRAQMVSPDFEITPANARAVDTIVGHLEGLPLAIELAAPRLQMLSPKALAARLQRRLPLLGDGALDRPARQQTMHGAIAWSYDLLTGEEQRVFRCLSVLQRGGSFDAAAAVVGENGERSILNAIAPLVDKNMVALVEDDAGEPRVSMLEMLREYAHERLVESGELAGAQRRHAEHVLDFAQRGQRELSGATQGAWLARFELEHGNIEAALEWAREDTTYAFKLLGAVWRFWWLHGHLTQGLTWIDRFLSQRAAAPEGVEDALYATVLRAGVVLRSALGNFDEAFAACEEAIAVQRRLGSEGDLAASLTSLGIIFQFRGEFDRAEDVHTESLTIRRRLSEDAGVATSLSNLASVAFSKGDFARTVELGEESVAIYRRLGHESGLAHALTKLGLAAAARREYERAEALFSECLRMQRAAGDLGSTHYSLMNLGAVAHRRGDYGLAITRFREALDRLDSMPNKTALAKILEDLGLTAAAVGDPLRAVRLLGAADALRRTLASPMFPSERADYDSDVAQIRGLLGDEAFDVQWRIGASVTLERALEEARETCVPTAVSDSDRH